MILPEKKLQLNALAQEKHIAIQCPDAPGVDSIAAAFGLYCFFRSKGKPATIFYAGKEPISRPNVVELVHQLSIPLEHRTDPAPCRGLIIAVGCQPGTPGATAIGCDSLVVLDNHPKATPLPEQSDIRPHLTCCATLVWHLLHDADYTLEKGLATALLYSLYIESNAFTEIRFPLDADMREALVIDEELFRKLERSNLSLQDLATTAQALNALEYHAEGRYVLVNVLPCDPSIRTFISTLAMRVNKVDMAVVFSETQEDVRFSISSAVRDVQATDLAQWFSANKANATGGTHEQAGGVIPAKECTQGSTTPLAFFQAQLQRYLNSYSVIDCAAITHFSTQGFRAYQKHPVELAYIRCEDVFTNGTVLHVRMLEGDITVVANADTYLMIGLQGEVYPIAKEKFDSLYTPTNAPANPRPFLYPPTVRKDNAQNRTTLLQHALGCISKEYRVLARQLDHGVKLFTRWDSRRYVRGNPGDWLIQPKNDSTDLYVITRELFPLLYTAVRPAQHTGE
ncbi:DHH family phosphoesterase [Desulfovibrio cuneatus]|uniref:DHH family phosphoesterase n=1 Tax=Desulfovibrio cuneatus TaxID=159728 RepID=UPI000489860E|nr:hypothetical protein [Desulfovibrio cuneatus]